MTGARTRALRALLVVAVAAHALGAAASCGSSDDGSSTFKTKTPDGASGDDGSGGDDGSNDVPDFPDNFVPDVHEAAPPQDATKG